MAMQVFTKSPLYNLSGAFGNGYVVVSKDSPLFGKHYDDALFDSIDVHGGMTYADAEDDALGLGGDGWVFGFDTQHYNDSAARWPDEASVLAEANWLKDQLEQIEAAQSTFRENTCPRCNIPLEPGKALVENASGEPDDLGGDIVTMSPDGTAQMVDCMKCPHCGLSRTVGSE